jgi:hypothetical protein
MVFEDVGGVVQYRVVAGKIARNIGIDIGQGKARDKQKGNGAHGRKKRQYIEGSGFHQINHHSMAYRSEPNACKSADID